MEIEVVARHVGQLRREDVRAALAERYNTARLVTVAVLGHPGQEPVLTVVALCWSRAGRAKAHRALACPECGRPRRVLFVSRRGSLGCAGCVGHLTRHQRERALVEYRHDGGREEDRLLRLVKKDPRAAGAVEKVKKLGEALVTGDLARARSLRPLVAAVLHATMPGCASPATPGENR